MDSSHRVTTSTPASSHQPSSVRDVVGAGLVALLGVGAVGPGPAPVAVEHDADVARERCRPGGVRRAVARRRRTAGSRSPTGQPPRHERSRPPYSRAGAHGGRALRRRTGPGACAAHMTRRRWLFGDQLGPHFLDDDDQPVLLVESRRGLRPPAVPPAEGAPGALGACATGPPSWATGAPTSGPAPTARPWPASTGRSTWSSRRRGRPCTSSTRCARADVDRLPARGFVHQPRPTSPPGRPAAAAAAADGGLLPRRPPPARRADGRGRAGGRPLELRRRQPRAAAEGPRRSGVPEPCWPVEDEIDARGPRRPGPLGARGGAIVGEDGPRRFAATRDGGAGRPATTSSSTGSPPSAATRTR